MQEDNEKRLQRCNSHPKPMLRRKERDWDAHSDPGQSSKVSFPHGERTPSARAATTSEFLLRPKKLGDSATPAYRTSYADGASFTTETQSYHSMHSRPSTEFDNTDRALMVDHTGYRIPSQETPSEQILNPYEDPPLLKMALNLPVNGHYPMLGGPSRQNRQINTFTPPRRPEPVVNTPEPVIKPLIPSPSHDPTYHTTLPILQSDHNPTQTQVPIFIERASPSSDAPSNKEEDTSNKDRVQTIRGTRPLSASTPPSSPPSIPLPAVPSTPSSARNSAEKSRPSVSASPRSSTDAGHGATQNALGGFSAYRGYSTRANAGNGSRSRPPSLNPSSSRVNTLVSRVPPSPTYPPPQPPSAGPSYTTTMPAKSSPVLASAPLISQPTTSTAQLKEAGDTSKEDMHTSKLAASRRRLGMPEETESPLNTRYINMLLAVDDIPQIHNILVSVFVWLLLAGFVLFPGTFTTLQESETAGIGGQVIGVVSQVPLFVIAWICTGTGTLGMLYFWWRWQRNYIWLVNKIFMPGFLNSLAGLLSTIATVYGVHTGDLTATSKSTLIVTGVALGACLLLVAIYQFVLLWRVKKEHDWTVGKGRAGNHGEGWIDTSKRKIKQAIV